MIELTHEDKQIVAYGLNAYADRMYQDFLAYKRQGNTEASDDCMLHYKRAREIAQKFYEEFLAEKKVMA